MATNTMWGLPAALSGAAFTGNVSVAGTLSATGTIVAGQPTPALVNVSATLTTANMLTRILTSTTAAAVTATLPTGTLMDGLYSAAVDVGYDWAIINTGPSAVTVAAGVDHTCVGNMAVATVTSGKFRSCRDAANVWVTYRV